MADGLLRDVWRRKAFDPAPSRSELHELHVPYDELTGRPSCEKVLRDALDRGERVALLGGSGAGKSSVASWVLGPLAEGVVPLAVPISPERPEVATDPVAFAEHVVDTIRAWVAASMPASAKPARSFGRSRKIGIGGTFAGFGANLTYELQELTKQRVRSDEVMQHAREILGVIASSGLRPVLVLDDTDKWINAAWSPKSHLERRQGFFGTVVRVLAEEFGVAAVVAVHPTYLTDEAYLHAQGFLATTIEMPRLPGAAAVGQILNLRASLSLAGVHDDVPDGIDELVDPDALDLLFDNYQRSDRGDVRRTLLQVAHSSLTRAVDSRHETIRRTVVETVISDLSPE